MSSKWLHFLPRRQGSRTTGVLTYVRNTTEELTGQSHVTLAQAQVRNKRNELKTWRQKVADATTRYDDVQHKLRHVYSMKTQLYQSQRRDLAALQAINSEEEELLSEEQLLGETLDSLKQAERECFEALGDSILDSHEKERAQSERMKYYSRLGSVVGAMLGFAGSNLFLRREVRQHQNLQTEKMENLEKTIEQLTPQYIAYKTGSSDNSETLDDIGVMQALQKESRRQSRLLDEARDELVTLSASQAGRSVVYNHVVTGLGIFVLSYAMCVISVTLGRR